jgi:DNA-binding response OmpR family regulator
MSAVLNIVLVEDHDALREVMIEVLSAKGHHVTGLDCAEALDDQFSRGPIDLIVADLNLPGEDGFSLVQRVRQAQPLIGIIMVTARHEVSDKVTGYSMGADIYLSKPVAPDELIAAVSSLSRRLSAHSSHTDLQATSNLRLDTRKLMLHGPLGETIVTDTESVILTALARAPSQRLEIWQILEMLGINMDTYNKSSFEVRIARLRKKILQVGGEKSSLRVVRMSGYQLCIPLQVY